jgi:hypothetical protein
MSMPVEDVSSGPVGISAWRQPVVAVVELAGKSAIVRFLTRAEVSRVVDQRKGPRRSATRTHRLVGCQELQSKGKAPASRRGSTIVLPAGGERNHSSSRTDTWTGRAIAPARRAGDRHDAARLICDAQRARARSAILHTRAQRRTLSPARHDE